MQQLFATIRESSKYFHQNKFDEIKKPIPFKVEINDSESEDYCVQCIGNQYRVKDVLFFVKLEQTFKQIS